VSAIAAIKLHKRSIVEKYATPDDWKGALQTLITLLPMALLWTMIARSITLSPLLFIFSVISLSLLSLRCFALMHDCGHRSLFRTLALNQIVGFVLGVINGMPQFVWAQHHNYHHANNGNWHRYRGPLSILSVDQFRALSKRQQRFYAAVRTIWLAPLAGLMYLIVSPRLNWLRGCYALLLHRLRTALGRTQEPFKPRHWTSPAQFWHMTANNLTLFASWAVACETIGAARFFPIYLLSVSLAGGLGILLFTVQHNFEHSYATGDEGWDYDTAALEGTSYLAMPAWLNWFTADIGYHHIHHISARIPNYRLAACQAEYGHLFTCVKRLTLSEVRRSLTYLLWDPASSRIISISECDALPGVTSPIEAVVSQSLPAATGDGPVVLSRS
jgi:omega-6 fatty acid desaturase (delta-12 desaturase)